MALGDDREATLELGRQLAGAGQTSSVVVYTADQGQDRSFVSALRAVGSPEQLGAFRDSLLTQIETLPAGPEIRSRVERRSRNDERPLRAPKLGLALVGVIVALFWAASDRDGLSQSAGYQWTLVRGLAAKGELYRVVTANWLHIDTGHLITNSAGLLMSAWLAERVLGWRPTNQLGQFWRKARE